MRLTALVAAPDHVCCRYRLAAFRPFLERAGHTLELIPWPRQRRGWLWALPALRRADVVIVQRRLPHTVLLRLRLPGRRGDPLGRPRQGARDPDLRGAVPLSAGHPHG
jgi:hypothetical protein